PAQFYHGADQRGTDSQCPTEWGAYRIPGPDPRRSVGDDHCHQGPHPGYGWGCRRGNGEPADPDRPEAETGAEGGIRIWVQPHFQWVERGEQTEAEQTFFC